MTQRNNKTIQFEESLLAKDSDLVKEWDYEKNNSLEIYPERVRQFSNKKVWWICSNCGHSWQATINNRSNGTACPKCAQEARNAKKRKAEKGVNDLETLYPDIAKTWNYKRNTQYLPSDLKPHSEVKVWWICEKGHEWESTISNRVRGNGCPICSSGLRTSLPEQAIFYYISKLLHAESRAIVDGWEVDVFLPEHNIGIEYDGWFYHSSDSAKKREDRKEIALKKSNVRLLRVKENQEYDKIEGDVISYIIESNYLHLEFAINAVISIISSIINSPLIVDIDFKRDRNEILNNYYNYAKEHSLEKEHPELAKEWDYQKNKALKPDMVSSGSGECVWWICEKGHSYKSIVGNRVRMGRGCPYCSNRRLLKGYNDLETTYPQIAKEWNYEKNDPIKPRDVLPKVSKKVWWVCPNGHEYQATVGSRTFQGTGCPYCARKTLLPGYNDLASAFPELVKEWNYDRNTNLSPEGITAFNTKKVWWVCPNGHEYQATVGSRTSKGTGCPYCSGHKVLKGFNDLAFRFPQLAQEWDYKKNKYLPSEVTYGSGKKAWWVCPSCGNEYQSAICGRTGQGHGCPKCGIKQIWISRGGRTKLIEKKPELLGEWDYQKNADLHIDPNTIDAYDTRKVWWICRECHHSWQASINGRVSGHGCPACGHKKTDEKRRLSTYENSLAGKFPELLEEWDYSENIGINPENIHFGTSTEVQWICKKCGYKWKARVSNRVHGKGCPACAHIVVDSGKNDLKTLFPEIANEFDEQKNGVSASKVLPNSNKKYWWICNKGHSYYSTASSRTTRNSGCPYCSGRLAIPGENDLKTLYPDLAKEWDYDKNVGLLPENILPGSGLKIWWRCKDGHSWQAAPYYRVKGIGCPVCREITKKISFNNKASS